MAEKKTVDKVKELVDAESDAYTILDVRQAADYAAGTAECNPTECSSAGSRLDMFWA